MISECLFCGEPLELSDPERPAERERIAFDPVRGRLWVVCPACLRWNPVPLEMRWEALEGFERLATDSGRVRLETENLALLRVGGGELIRVGDAPRPEYAGWRYGDRLTARKRRGFWARLIGNVPEAPPAGYDFQGVPISDIGPWVASPFIGRAASLTSAFLHLPLAPECPSCGAPLPVRPWEFQDLRYSRAGDAPVLIARCGLCGENVTLPPAAARPALRVGLSIVNREIRDTTLAESAGSEIDRAGGADAYLYSLARDEASLGELADHERLALGIGLDDQAEAEALEREWREAEEIAAIVDRDLTWVPGFEEFRRRVLEEGGG